MEIGTDRYALARVSDIEWVICDLRYGTRDPRRIVAQIWEVDTNECEVLWMREQSLAAVYASAADALADLRGASRHGKPVPIPHFPPAVLNDRTSAAGEALPA